MLIVGTSSGVHSFACDGDRWEPRARTLDGAPVTGLAAEDGRLLASVRGRGVYQSQDAGSTWTPLLEGVDARCVAAAPDGAVYVGAYPAAVYRCLEAGDPFEELASVRSLAGYPSWNFPVPPHIGQILSLAFSPSDRHTVYAGVEVGGIIRTMDDGESWEEFHEGLHLDVHTLASAPIEGADVLYAATGQGFFRSTDRGVSWESSCEGLDTLYMVPLAVHPEAPRLLISAATRGRPRYWRDRPEGAAGTIYRSTDGGTHWEPSMNGLPSTLPGQVEVLAIDRIEADLVYGGTLDGTVLASRDRGQSWAVVAEGLAPVQALVAIPA